MIDYDYRECELAMEERALEIIQRVFVRLQRDPADADAQNQIQFFSRLTGTPHPATVLTPKNLADTLSFVSGGSEQLVTEVLNCYLELRAVAFADVSVFDGWVTNVTKSYTQFGSDKSVLDSDFLRGLPTVSMAQSTLQANPWALVFLVFPRINLVTAADSRGNITITIKRKQLAGDPEIGD